jgi:integrase
MLPMGRPREKGKDLPLGVYPVKGRFYVRPVNEEMRRIFAVAFPGIRCAPLGADKAEARKLWVKLFITDVPPQDAKTGTVAEIIERYEREIIPTLHSRTGADHETYCKRLNAGLGRWKYAKSEAEASSGPFLRSMHVTAYLRAQEAAARPVQGNKEIRCLARIFRLAKTLWGYTEYNPCLQVEFNTETPRSVYVTDDMFEKVYGKASPVLQCMMDLAQMVGARRGMILKLTLADMTDKGLMVTLNKRKRTEGIRRQLIRWWGADRQRHIGDVTVWSSERGRRFPTKAWDEEYFQLLADSEHVLCPSGDYQWSYRFFEACLCGAVPIVEQASPLYDGFRYRLMTDARDAAPWSAADAEHNYRVCAARIVVPVDELDGELARLAALPAPAVRAVP